MTAKRKTPEELRLREIWRSVRKRTENPRCKDYAHYWARGIRMCEEWHDFDVFCHWALTHGYRNDLTLDRFSNKGGYSPGNCHWVSRKAQAENRTTNKYIEVDGVVRTLTQWSEMYGVAPDRILRRMQNGWSAKKAVTTPVRAYAKK